MSECFIVRALDKDKNIIGVGKQEFDEFPSDDDRKLVADQFPGCWYTEVTKVFDNLPFE